MAKIVGIHGIGQQFGGAYELGAVWYNAIRDGLDRAGHQSTAKALAPGDVRVAFFGDLFRPAGTMAVGAPPYTAAAVKQGTERDLLERWYEAAVEQNPSLAPPVGAMGAGKVAVQTMLYRVLQSRTFAGMVSERWFIGNLKQVTEFLAKPGTKERVLQRVGDEVTPDTRIVVGHSLGSVVIYEYLARFAPPQVQLLVTLGSPLGIPNLIFERLTPTPAGGVGAWPGDVGRWVNVADADDIVALCKKFAPLFPARQGAAPVEDHLVDNGDQAHAISRYLNAVPTGAALGRVL
jgi:hypothetical protein